MILTEAQVIRYSLAKQGNTAICKVLDRVVNTCLLECFGQTFIDLLNASWINYDTTPDYIDTKEYDIGDRVRFDNKVYEALEDCNISGFHVETAWKELGCFSDDCLEWIWDTYLREYLSHKVFCASVPYLIHDDKYDRAKRYELVAESEYMASDVISGMEKAIREKYETDKTACASLKDIKFLNDICGCWDEPCYTTTDNRVAF